jgi:hypothetical protein
MRIFLAGTPGTEVREKHWQRKILRRLLSYWDIKKISSRFPLLLN